jgi:aerobic-type carbon monoxide dehydrogenase small subunit (CoxS/CutS family)
MKKELAELRINGLTHELAIEPNALLLDVLRRDLNLTGSKRGCDDSSCGSCTVLVDGTPMLSCTMLAVARAGAKITTPWERGAFGGTCAKPLRSLKKASGDWGGAQCGFCTSWNHHHDSEGICSR